MRRWPIAFLLVAALVVIAGGCGAGEPARPPGVAFTKVELPGGAAAVVLSASEDTLLIGVRRPGQPVVPGLLRLDGRGAINEVPVQGVTPYGLLARWRSIAFDGERILALGGERGGAHGHVRWSVWSGSTDGLDEQRQGFSTFGGYEAGDMVDAVLAPAGGALVGAWASARLGFDVAVWTLQGEDWIRQSSAGTALESSETGLGFPMAAAAAGDGILVAGWQVRLGAGGSGQQPVVWQSSSFNTGWTATALPDAGDLAAALAVRCWSGGCGVAGRVDGKLAVWQLSGGAWARRPGLPPVPVGDRDRLAAPIELGGQLFQPMSDGGQVKLARVDGDGWAVRTVDGPTGTVTAMVRAGDTVYLLAGPDEDSQTLWRANIATLS